MELKTDSRSHLVRARQLLDVETDATLFYAAYELRCCIERRLIEYSYAEEETLRRKRRGWKIAQIARGLKKAALAGDTIAKFTFMPDGGSEMTLYYTPVTRFLRKSGQRLGELLHGNKPTRLWEPGGMERERAHLETVYQALKIATFGTLLAPPLINKDKKVKLLAEFPDGPDSALDLKALLVPQTRCIVHVSYLKSLSEEMPCVRSILQ